MYFRKKNHSFLNLMFSFLYILIFNKLKWYGCTELKYTLILLTPKVKKQHKRPWIRQMWWIFKCELNKWPNIDLVYFWQPRFLHFVSFFNNLNRRGCIVRVLKKFAFEKQKDNVYSLAYLAIVARFYPILFVLLFKLVKCITNYIRSKKEVTFGLNQ
jgi:hypothetical protein